jgi:hypothetical protein
MKPKKCIKKPQVLHIDSEPENADWLHIIRAERIARQVPGGGQLWAEAVRQADGNRSAALVIFYRLLEEAGIERPD